MSDFDIRIADLSATETRDLLELHLRGMRAASPPGSVFALDLSGLQQPNVTVWSVHREGRIAGIGALKLHGDGTAQVKSMRTHPDFLRQGVAAALLETIIGHARGLDARRVSLETGSGEAFEAALALYRRRGFRNGEVFADYEPSEFNQFLHMDLPRDLPAAHAEQA